MTGEAAIGELIPGVVLLGAAHIFTRKIPSGLSRNGLNHSAEAQKKTAGKLPKGLAELNFGDMAM